MTARTPAMTTPLELPPSWNISNLVAQLKVLREASLVSRQRQERPVKLPSRKALATIVEGIAAAMFPNRLGTRELADDSVDYFVGSMLDESLRQLVEQIARELRFTSENNLDLDDSHLRAMDIVQEFAAELPTIRALLETDINAAYRGDPSARSVDEVLACYPGVMAIVHHRLAHALCGLNARLSARVIAENSHSTTGIDIHPAAQIGNSFFIDHGTGVVIGETAIIGNRVRLYHGVTLGAKSFSTDEDGNIIKGHARHPIVEDDVVIYANATILGRITIGQGSMIGGNVWLTRSVPPGSNISQARLRGEAFDSGSGI